MPAEEQGHHGFDPDRVVVANTAIMQSLANPLRMRLLGLLRVHGPSTATKLAARVGESSGLTSYHLRQLASVGLVTEAGPEDLMGVRQTGGRERWWKASHEATAVTQLPDPDDEAATAAIGDYARAVLAASSAKAHAWLSTAYRWPVDWRDTTSFDDTELHLTVAEATRLRAELGAVLAKYRHHSPGAEPPPGTAIVSAQFQVFPYPDQEPPAE
jgi:DNA-binding transcriptional ArsR family regulator